MEILLWLLPATLATLAAMAVAGWVGRERPVTEQRKEREQQRFAAAMARPLPTSTRVRRPPSRSTGVTVRYRRSA